MSKLAKNHKEIIRYFIVAIVMAHIGTMTYQAYTLEQAGTLTMQFAGIVALEYPVITFILKYIFHSEVSE